MSFQIALHQGMIWVDPFFSYFVEMIQGLWCSVWVGPDVAFAAVPDTTEQLARVRVR